MTFITPQQLLEKRIKERKDRIWESVQDNCILRGKHICLTKTEFDWFKDEVEPVINSFGWESYAEEQQYEDFPVYYFVKLKSIEGINTKPEEWTITII